MAMLRPSTYPNSPSPCRKASTKCPLQAVLSQVPMPTLVALPQGTFPSAGTTKMRQASSIVKPSACDAAPVLRELLGAAQRQRVERERRIGRARGRENSAPGDVEIGELVGLAIAVDDGIARARSHDCATQEVLRRDPAAPRPDVPGAGALGDLHAFVEGSVPQAHRVLVEGVNDARERKAELVLFRGELDPVLAVRQFLADGGDTGEPARLALEEIVELLAEQVGTHIGDAAHIGRLLRRARVPEGAAECAFACRFGVAVVGHELIAERAEIVLQVFVEDGGHRRAGVDHLVGTGQLLSNTFLARPRSICGPISCSYA